MENQINPVKLPQSEFNGENSQNQNLSFKSKHPERLSRLLGTIGVIILFLVSITDVLFYNSKEISLFELLFFFLFFILPVLIGIIAIKKRPIMSGGLMIIQGLIYLSFSSVIVDSMGRSGIDLILAFAGLLLISGGMLAITRDKEILGTEKGDSKLFKIGIVILCFFIFSVIYAVLFTMPSPSGHYKANNAKVKSDLSQIMLSVEMYYSDNNSVYPKQAGNGFYCGDSGIIADESGIICGGFPFADGYIETLPKSPNLEENIKGSDYNYIYSSSVDGYTISALLNNGKIFKCSNGSCSYEEEQEKKIKIKKNRILIF